MPFINIQNTSAECSSFTNTLCQTWGILSLECVDANGPTIIHTGTGSAVPGSAKGEEGAG